MKELKFIVVSDPHYYSKKVGITGPDFEKASAANPMDLVHSSEILGALCDQLIAEEEKIILFSGDLTSNGEPDSHEEMLALLQKLVDAGKEVYVISSTHDYKNDGLATYYTNEGTKKVPTFGRLDMSKVYHSFGYDQALSVDKTGQAYVAQLAPGFRLFALNSDNDGTGCSGYGEEMMQWIDEQVKDAQKNNQAIIAMAHHPMISPSPFYSIIGANDMMGGHKTTREHFSDIGIRFIFTGHSHVQDISYIVSKNGNVFYDITTPGTTAYPSAYRKAVYNVESNTLEIKTVKLTSKPDFDLGGKSLDEHLYDKFFGMIGRMLKCAETDMHMFARMANGISIRPWVTYRAAWIIKPVATILNRLTVKDVWKLCKKETGLKKADIADVADIKVVDLILEYVSNLYGGDGKYTPDTSIYKVTMGICSIFDSILRTLHVDLAKILKNNASSVSELVEPLLYNSGIPDADAVLDLDPHANVKVNGGTSSVKRSKKGPAIVVIAALAIVALLPIEVIALLCGYIINQIKYGKYIKGYDAQRNASTLEFLA